MAAKLKVDQLETVDGTGNITVNNQLTGLTSASMPTGSVLQVVQAHSTLRTVLSTSTYTNISLSASITPSSTSSKILIIADLAFNVLGGAGFPDAQILGDGSSLKTYPYISGWTGLTGTVRMRATPSLKYIDSPSTTSSVTYSVQGKENNSDTIEWQDGNQVSTITLMEIAG